MVVISRVYTRTGDGGTTRLSDMSEVPKTDVRVAAYGDVDEANSIIGMALAAGGLSDRVVEVLGTVQNELFDLGADLSTPVVADPGFPPLRILPASVDRLERWCDEFSADVPPLRSFILPGGTPAAATLHLARTVTRRAERQAWLAYEAYGDGTAVGADDADGAGDASGSAGGLNPVAITYLNRLSDLLFVLTRHVNGTEHEVLWVPGQDRPADAPSHPRTEPTADPTAPADAASDS